MEDVTTQLRQEKEAQEAQHSSALTELEQEKELQEAQQLLFLKPLKILNILLITEIK